MADVISAVVDPLLKKYGIPVWVKPYLKEYVKSDPVNAIKRATSFIDVKRKKGQVTNNSVVLPNNTAFKTESVVGIVSLFFYGEERSVQIAEKWSSKPDYLNKEYVKHFSEMVEIEKRHLRAIKNLLEGLGHKPLPPSETVKEVFDYIENLQDWNERLVAMNIIIKSTYGTAFGMMFYKVFYFVMPEYMRSFGKAFDYQGEEIEWGFEEAKRIISEKCINEGRLIEMSERILTLISKTINSEMLFADEAGITREAELLKKVALAYPLHIYSDLGINIDIEGELKKIYKESE
ncbi:MAG: hypothetical protein M1364_02300 [Candidatus Marsarchaeota archaeon]|jgi:hypothetical protein|nr:hypothetical protein [Candidatus Marsarchaeota archaeon]